MHIKSNLEAKKGRRSREEEKKPRKKEHSNQTNKEIILYYDKIYSFLEEEANREENFTWKWKPKFRAGIFHKRVEPHSTCAESLSISLILMLVWRVSRRQ